MPDPRDTDGRSPEAFSQPTGADAVVINPDKLRLVLVGGGMAAQHFVEHLISHDRTDRYSITMICEEPSPPYDRVHLGSVLGDHPRTLVFRDEDWYRANGIALRVKDPVLRIDREAQRVDTQSGASLEYDELVLATGGTAFLPPLEGNRLPNVLTYRTLEDAERIQRGARQATHVIVAGGGLLGLEAARAVQKVGCEVTVVEMAPRLLPRQLDVEGADVLERQIRRLGLELRLLTRLTRIVETEARLRAELSDGSTLDTDLVIFASGIRPNDQLARDAGLDCHASGGIEVDETLTTSDPRIRAIGECARHGERLYGFVAPCYEMAEVLADRLLHGTRTFVGAETSARLKLEEVDVAAIGESLADGTTVRDLTWVAPDQYRRVVIRAGRIVGAIAVGAGSEFPRLQESVATQARIRASQERRFARTGHLWKPGTLRPVELWPDAAVVCTCTGVTCGSLRSAWADGCQSSVMLTEATGAGSVCGNCKPLIAGIAGEVATTRRRGAGSWLGLMASISLVAIGIAWALGPIPMSTSVTATPSIDFLWREAGWKQVSGYTLLALMTAGLLLPLRKRIAVLERLSFPRSRQLHTAIGLGTLLAAGIHTGLRLGANLNLVLMSCFLGLTVLGSMSALVTSVEHRLSPRLGSALRIGWKRAHVALFWPMPVLVLFHVLAFYLY